MGYIFTLLVVLFPVLGQVGLPIQVPFITANVSLGMLLLIPFVVVYLCDKWPVKGLFAIRPVRLGGTVGFAFALLLLSVIGASSSGGGYAGLKTAVIALVFLPLLILTARGNFRVSYGMSAYVFFSVCFSLYLVLQVVLLAKGYGYLSDGFFSDSYIFAGAELSRFVDTGFAASFFLSGDAFALYVLPALVYLLLWDRSGYRFFPFAAGIILSAAIALSGSAVGIILMLLVWAVYVILPTVYFLLHPADAVYRFTHGGAPRIISLILTFMICTTMITLYLIDGTASKVLAPVFEEILGGEALIGAFSAVSRVLVTRSQLLCGVGFGNVDAAFGAIGESAPALSLVGEILLSCGVLGLAALALLLVGLMLRSRGKFGYTLALMLILLSSFTSVGLLPTFVFWFFISHAVGKIEMPFKRYMRVEY